MRLLQLGPGDELTLTKNLKKHDRPSYAILSHTWGDEEDEVTFRDIMEKTGKDKPGYQKILFCGRQARADNLDYFWVDTCCIDKTSSAELQVSITSMSRWYRDSKICYVYLEDVSRDEDGQTEMSRATWQHAFRRSRWFTRGWTLQELVAPASVSFFGKDGSLLDDKKNLKQQVSAITGIAETALLGGRKLTDFGVSERYEWARNRQTSLEEDWAYSLQGIFNVSLLPIYGEGRASAVSNLVGAIKKALLGVEVEGVIVDDVRQRRFINPLLLDIALLETLSLLDKARAQAERHRSIVHESATNFAFNNGLVSDMATLFFKFLRRLLWPIFSPIVLLQTLERTLDVNAIHLRSIIVSNNKIASNLQREEEHSQKTLDKLKMAQDFIQSQMGSSTPKTDDQSSVSREIEILKKYVEDATIEIKEEERQQTGTEQAGTIERQYEEHVRLKERFPKVHEECQQQNQILERVIKKGKEKKNEIEARARGMEAKLEEAEQKHREWENKTVLQKIWAWIVWLASCGSDE